MNKPKLQFKIDGKYYIVSDKSIKRGDLVVDKTDFTYGRAITLEKKERISNQEPPKYHIYKTTHVFVRFDTIKDTIRINVGNLIKLEIFKYTKR